jgi:hypothetical protein
MAFLMGCVPVATRSLLCGESPGIGKTALLRCLVDKAPAFRVVRCVGVESEMEPALRWAARAVLFPPTTPGATKPFGRPSHAFHR